MLLIARLTIAAHYVVKVIEIVEATSPSYVVIVVVDFNAGIAVTQFNMFILAQ
jgi:hypothetical protein